MVSQGLHNYHIIITNIMKAFLPPLGISVSLQPDCRWNISSNALKHDALTAALGPYKEIWMCMKADAATPQRASHHCLLVKCQAASAIMIKIHLNKDQQPVKWASVVTQTEAAFCKWSHENDGTPAMTHPLDVTVRISRRKDSLKEPLKLNSFILFLWCFCVDLCNILSALLFI